MPGFVSVATDFGAAYTGICVGVVASIAPDARVLVLTDEVTAYAVVEGAMLLRQALPYLPVGVHVGIVDPGVGTARRPIAVRCGRGDVLVGPDNGVLIPAAQALGGVTEARLLAEPSLRLPSPAPTFHGRDIFSPAAAHIANGVALDAFGPVVAPAPPVLPTPVVATRALTATVLYADGFGSVVLGAEPTDLAAAFGPVTLGATFDVGGRAVTWTNTYGNVPVGAPLLYTDSSGNLALAVNQGSAAALFALRAGDAVTLTSAGVPE